MGNHLSLRPEPGADNAVERRLALYLVLLREEFTLTTELSHTHPVGSYPTISTLPHPKGCLAVYFLLHLSFRGLSSAASFFSKGLPAPCSPDFPQPVSGRQRFSTLPDILPAAIARGHMFQHLIYIKQTEYASIQQAFFVKSHRYSTKMRK